MTAVIKMDINNIIRSITLAKGVVKKNRPITTLMVKILELKLFVMKKLEDGSNCAVLLPSLKKKLNELCCAFLEGLEEEMELKICNEGQFLTVSNVIQSWHKDVSIILDLLESGLVIKCVTI